MLLIALVIGAVLALCAHELGHILVARALGMTVKHVKLCSGRTIATWTMWGIRWSMGWLPIAAYTTIPGAFRGRGAGQRAMVIAAGPLISAAIAIGCTWLLQAGMADAHGWLAVFTLANAVLALLSLSPVTGADSPALIGLFADHWFLGTGGRVVLGLLWTAFPIAFAWAVRSLPVLLATYW